MNKRDCRKRMCPLRTFMLLAPGAVFYWFVGRAVSNYGQVERISTIRFRRLPMWTARRLERGTERSRGLAATLRYEP